MKSQSKNDQLLQQQPQNKQNLPYFIINNKQTFAILFFQTIGMIIFTYGFVCSRFNVPIKLKIANPYSDVFAAFSLCLAMFWCRKFSRGFLNPAVTVAFLFKSDPIGKKQAILHIISQFIGAIIGSFFAYVFFDATAGPYSANGTITNISVDVLGEILGTFFFVIFFMMVYCKDTTFITQEHWMYVFIPITYFICRTFPARIGNLNPALGFAFQLFESVRNSDASLMYYSLIGLIVPLIGAIIAAVLFQRFYRQSFKYWKSVVSTV